MKLSGISDIYEQFGHIANICQIVDILPFERYDAIFKQTERFRMMIDCLFDHQECIQNDEIVSQKCLWPRLHACVSCLEKGTFQGVNIKNDRAERPYFTKSSDREPDFSIETEKQKIKKTCTKIMF